LCIYAILWRHLCIPHLFLCADALYTCVFQSCVFYSCASYTSLHARPVCSRAVHSVLVHRLVPWQPDLFILHLCFSILRMLYLCVPDSCFTSVSSVFVCCELCIVLESCCLLPVYSRHVHSMVAFECKSGFEFPCALCFVTSDLNPTSLCNRCLHLNVHLILLFECKSDFAVLV